MEFNNRFDILAERIRQRKHLELEEEKRNYLFAVEKYAPSIPQREKNQYQINRTGLTIEELKEALIEEEDKDKDCLLYTSPSPRDRTRSRMPSSA